MNGKVDILAKAMRDVFTESMEHTRDAVLDEMGEMETRLKEDTAQQLAAQETRFNTSLGKLLKTPKSNKKRSSKTQSSPRT